MSTTTKTTQDSYAKEAKEVNEKIELEPICSFSPVERFFLCRAAEGYTNLNFHVTARFNMPVDDILLSNALKLLIERNPIFSLNYFRTKLGDSKYNGDNFVRRPVNSITYNQVVESTQEEGFTPKLAERIGMETFPLDAERPTWRVLKLTFKNNEPPALTFVCNHTLFDGNAAAIFFDELIWCFNEVQKTHPNSLCKVLFWAQNDKITGYPTLDRALHVYAVPFLFFVKSLILEYLLPTFLIQLFTVLFCSNVANTFKHPVFDPIPQKTHNKLCYRFLFFTPQESNLIMARAKAIQLTMTPFIGGCAHVAAQETMIPYANRLQGYDQYRLRTMNFPIAICGRRYVPESKRERLFGLLMAQAEPQVPPQLDTVKLAGHYLKNDVVRATATRQPFKYAGMLRYVNAWHFWKRYLSKAHKRDGIEVSNLGCKKLARGKWEVTDMIFCQGVAVTHLTISVSSTPLGGLNIVIASVDDLDEWKKGETKVMDNFTTLFRTYLAGE